MEPQESRAARWFARFTGTIHQALPQRLRRIVPLTFIGYAFINGSGFLLDMGLLRIFKGTLHWHYPIAVSVGYTIAAIYSFLLNRWLNFRSHGNVGTQSAKYTFTMVSNYVLWIFAYSSIAEHFGMHYLLARFSAACIEGVYVYLMLRLFVFRRRPMPRIEDDVAADTEPSAASAV